MSEETDNDFEYQPYINEIAHRLWNEREYGKAAVMIGAGFSRNAETSTESGSNFPTWNDLSELFFNRLYIGTEDPTEKRKIIADKGPLKLAQEFEAAHGRDALDALLRRNIPDEEFQPSKIHKLLLYLPWSDIFTTNYDTLLERTAEFIHERKYDMVYTAEDIPTKMKPRIIKLHGSFHSQRPFIITQEDYRTYPWNFSPFVNLVQQSIMENAFCLLGFSGEDPNFLEWIGWVRDNLGSNAPKIYLCNILNLSPSERQVLEDQNIVPIDLSTKFPKSKYTNEHLRYKHAMEWFLLNLLENRPPALDNWPAPPGPDNPFGPSNDLPPLPSNKFTVEEENPSPSNPTEPLEEETFFEKLESWKKNRKLFPGWEVLPKRNSNILWRYTEYWIDPMLEYAEEEGPPYDLIVLYELLWRLDKSRVPLWDDLINRLYEICEKYDPYSESKETHEKEIRIAEAEEINWDGKKIEKIWVEINFFLLKYARENFSIKRFEVLLERLESVKHKDDEWAFKWKLEKLTFSLQTLNFDEMEKQIKNWEYKEILPFWEARKASLLAEYGNIQQAQDIAEKALKKIRKELDNRPHERKLLSQEGWVMYLLITIKDIDFEGRDYQTKNQKRFKFLDQYDCNPITEVKEYRIELKQPLPRPKPKEEKKSDFIPGKFSKTKHLSSEVNLSDYIPAFSFLKLVDESGLPVKVTNVNRYTETIIESAKWIAHFNIVRAIFTLIRAGDSKELNNWFDRTKVASLDEEQVGTILEFLISSMGHVLDIDSQRKIEYKETTDSLMGRVISAAPETLAKLSLRAQPKIQEEIVELGCEMYTSEIYRTMNYRGKMSKFFEYLFDSIDDEILDKKLDILLSLPVMGNEETPMGHPHRIAEPFELIKYESLQKSELTKNNNERINELIEIVSGDSLEKRERSTARLATLYEAGLLNDEQTNSFGESIWEKTNSKSKLPEKKYHYNFFFLLLPHPEGISPKKIYREWLRAQEIPRINRDDQKVLVIFNEWLKGTVTYDPLQNDNNHNLIDWELDAIVGLLEGLEKWLDDHEESLPRKEGIKDPFGRMDYFDQIFEFIPRILCRVILPRLRRAPEEYQETVKKIINKLNESNIPVHRVLPLAEYLSENPYDTGREIRDGMSSLDETVIRESILGLKNWIIHSQENNLESPPEDLIGHLIGRIINPRQPGLDWAIYVSKYILQVYPNLVSKNQVDSICVGLEYLFKETELLTMQEQLKIDQKRELIKLSERPDYRKLASQLSHEIKKYYEKKDEQAPEILTEWEKVYRNSNLPEVSKVWF